MIMNIAFKLEQLNTPNKLLIDFGPKFFKILLITNGQASEIYQFPNTLFHISENRVQNLEREFKDAFKLTSGMFTRQEVESAQLLLQADEQLVDLSQPFQIERAYTNLFEILPSKVGIDFRTDEIDFETWTVFLAIPVTANFNEIVNVHLNTLKTNGFKYITPFDYLTSSFYSQKALIGDENVKHKYGILVNVSDKTEIGVFDEELIDNGYTQLSLGVNSVIEYSLAILRDLNIRGFKRELLEEWVLEDGTCLNDAQTVIKNIRKKDVDIKILLNSPFILFDYFKVTGMKNDPNSIPDGIINLLQSQKKIRKNIKKILSNVIIVGPGSQYKGFDVALKSSLSSEYDADSINIIQGLDPTNSELNGLIEYLSTSDAYDCYNITRVEIDDATRKALEKKFDDQLKEIDSALKDIKAKKYFYPDNLVRLNLSLNGINKVVESLPDGLNTSVDAKIFDEIQKLSKEFGKQLKGYKKSAEKNLESATESLQQLSIIANRINNFSIPFLRALFSNQISSIIVEVRNNKTSFEEKMFKENLKTVSKILKKELSKEQWITLDNLSQKSKLSVESLLKIKDELLQESQEFGYIDGRFVNYNMDILVSGYDFLDNLQTTIETKISSNDSFELKSDFEQASEYCSFLMKGFLIVGENDYLDSVMLKNEYLQEERKQIFD